MDTDQPADFAAVPRSASALFDAVVATLEDGKAYQVGEVDRAERAATFRLGADPATAAWTYRVTVSEDDGLSGIEAALLSPSAASLSSREQRGARRTTRRFTREVLATLDRAEPSAAETKASRGLSVSTKAPLARLTRRRPLVAALVLLGVYAVPLLLGLLVGVAAAAGLLGTASWVPVTLALVLGYGVFLVATVKLGGWAQAISWGEEYMLTFRPIAGFALAWWRVALQLGGLILIALLASEIDDAATLRRISNAETAALPDYVARAPIPSDWERVGSSSRQSEYADGPNATYRISYGAPGTLTVADLETFLRDPGWAAGVDGRPPFGELGEIDCNAEYEYCTGEVVPPAGGESEYDVELRIDDVFIVTMDDGTRGTYVSLEVEYEQAA